MGEYGYKGKWERFAVNLEDTQRCPRCSAATQSEGMCPGYPGKDRNGNLTVMVCSEGCDGTQLVFCVNDQCDWWYADPWNRQWTFVWYTDSDRPERHEPPMGERPEWYDDLAYVWDDDEDD